MGAPRYEIIQTGYQNPHATDELKLNILVVSNTPEKQIIENIKTNSNNHTQWLRFKEPHDKVAVLIGGGWSINDCVDQIKTLYQKGATIVAMNGSSKWCRDHDIEPDWQVIVDAKEETAQLVDPKTPFHYFASQCDPKTVDAAPNVILCHFGLERIEEYLPDDRVKAGGYTLLGAGVSAGNAAMSIAFSQGYRELHLFGYDSSYHEDNSHAYEQKINQFMPTTEITWGGKTFIASVAMKGQAEKFPLNVAALNNAGCEVFVYGEGLLQTIYRTKFEDLTEREKYQLMWSLPAYRIASPGEQLVDKFIDIVKPKDNIIDFGCGTGRAAVRLAEKGYSMILMDFTDNCRDEEAQKLPFVQWDLTKPIPIHAHYGFCTDVMEHIPPNDVETVIKNIMDSSSHVFFQISTVVDAMGSLIGKPLHLTIKPHNWWRTLFIKLGYKVDYDEQQRYASIFYVNSFLRKRYGNPSRNSSAA